MRGHFHSANGRGLIDAYRREVDASSKSSEASVGATLTGACLPPSINEGGEDAGLD